MQSSAPALVATLLLAACGTETASTSAVVTDSAGVSIVTNMGARLDHVSRWTLAAEPALSIETPEDGSFTLFRVGDVAALRGGRIAVANGRPPEVLVFGPDGTLVSRFGDEGDGPGEFRDIGSIETLPGDSLAVFDWRNHRLSVLDAEGRLGHVVDLGRTITQAGAAFADIHALADGDLVLFTGGNFNSVGARHEGPFRAESESIRIGSDGDVLASYGSFPGQEQFANAGGAGNVFFGAWTDVATVGDDLVVGTEKSPELRTYRPDGTLARVIRWPDDDRAVTRQIVDSFLDTLMVEGRVPEPRRARTRAALARIPHAAEVPPYRTVLGAGDGRLWVGDYQPMAGIPGMPPTARHWLIFKPDGTVIATIDTPAGFEPKVIEGSRVYGVFTDDVGVESVRAYTIRET